MKKNLHQIIFSILWIPLFLIVYLAFAWIPMIGWNHGLHTVWPNVFPIITYWQSFFIFIAVGGLFARPQFHNKD